MDAVNADKSVEEEAAYVFCSEEEKKTSQTQVQIRETRKQQLKFRQKTVQSESGLGAQPVLGMEESEKFALIA